MKSGTFIRKVSDIMVLVDDPENRRCWILDTGYWMLDIGYWILETMIHQSYIKDTHEKKVIHKLYLCLSIFY